MAWVVSSWWLWPVTPSLETDPKRRHLAAHGTGQRSFAVVCVENNTMVHK